MLIHMKVVWVEGEGGGLRVLLFKLKDWEGEVRGSLKEVFLRAL